VVICVGFGFGVVFIVGTVLGVCFVGVLFVVGFAISI
jgi:hypothetical protein